VIEVKSDPELIDCRGLVVVENKRAYLYCEKHGLRLAEIKMRRGFDLRLWFMGRGRKIWNNRDCKIKI